MLFSSVLFLLTWNLVSAVVHGFNELSPTEVFYTKDYTYFMTKSTTTIYLCAKTGGHNSIRFCDRSAVTAPSDEEPCYEICLECSHLSEEFTKNRNATATSVTYSLMKDEWNAFTIARDYVGNRMWLGQKDVDWPVIQFNEFPSDTLIKPIRYFGIRTDCALFEDKSHWIIGLGDGKQKYVPNLQYSKHQMSFSSPKMSEHKTLASDREVINSATRATKVHDTFKTSERSTDGKYGHAEKEELADRKIAQNAKRKRQKQRQMKWQRRRQTAWFKRRKRNDG